MSKTSTSGEPTMPTCQSDDAFAQTTAVRATMIARLKSTHRRSQSLGPLWAVSR
jgi:hypothetical protein